jgi:3-oxoacyl-[acyl-carrier protein] reductase
MDLAIRGKTALVGGASRGLGRAVCEQLAREGVNLIMVARHEVPLTAEAGSLEDTYGIKAIAVPGDLSRAEDIEDMLQVARERLNGVDILVHNTGGPPPGLFVDHTDDAWTVACESLLLSVVRMCRGVMTHMKQRGWGRIILNTSFTVKEPAPRLILSNVFRTAVVALAKTLSREVAEEGITVNCVCPGAFDTARLRAIFDEQADASRRPVSEIAKEWESRVPIGRILRPQELGYLVAFLASDLAGGITGTTLPIEGGMLHGLF